MADDRRSDATLIDSYVRNGDQDAFAVMVGRHGPLVYRCCLRVLGDRHGAEDAAQAVFIVLARKARSLRKKGGLQNWLHGVARNVALRAHRGRSSARRREEAFAMARQGSSQDARNPQKAEALPLLDEALASLSARQRQAVLLRYLQNHSEKEAAAIAGCSTTALSRRASDGMARLRERLCRRGVQVSAGLLISLCEAEGHAAMPDSLLSKMLAASRTVATGAQTEAVSESVWMLSKGVTRMMFWKNAMIAGCVWIAVAALGIGTSIALAETAPVAEKPQRKKKESGWVKKAGLEVHVTPGKKAFAPSEDLAFEIRMRNGSTKPFKLNNIETFQFHRYQILERDSKKQWEARFVDRLAGPGGGEELAAGAVKNVRAVLSRRNAFRFFRKGQAGKGSDRLPAGSYILRVTLRFTEPFNGPRPAPREVQKAFWLGEIESAPVEFRVGTPSRAEMLNGLTLRVKPHRDVFESGNRLRFVVVAKNTSQRAYKLRASVRILSAVIEGETGSFRAGTVVGHFRPGIRSGLRHTRHTTGAPKPGMDVPFYELKPNATDEYVLDMNLSRNHIVLEALGDTKRIVYELPNGQYSLTLKIAFEQPKWLALMKGKPVWVETPRPDVWSGEITANPVAFSVKKGSTSGTSVTR